MKQIAEASPEEIQLSKLLVKYQDRRREDRSIGIGTMRNEAGALFPQLVELADCESLIHIATTEEGAEEGPEEFAGYRILETIGKGAAGVVFRAVPPDGTEPVALKVMRPSLSASAEALERFRQEAKVAGSLDHKHLVKIFDFGEVDGRMFIAMELLKGSSLADVLASLKNQYDLPPDERWLEELTRHGVPDVEDKTQGAAVVYARRLAALLAPVADGLEALAQADIVHRDLKPHNLVLDGKGKLKITDFGLAKVFGHDMTSTLAVMGTPAYMSPEQARGDSRRVDRRSDIFSLGATFYEALTLRFPVVADTLQEMLGAIASQRPIPVDKICPAYPKSLSLLVSRCLEREPEDRYQNPARLSKDLESFAGAMTVSIGAVPVRRRAKIFVSKNRGATMTVGAGALLVLLGVLFFMTRSAYVEIDSLPRGRIFVDGEEKSTPWKEEISAGDYDLEIRRDRFRPYQELFEVSPGVKYPARRIYLDPIDPLDKQTLNEISEALGHGRLPSGAPAPAAHLRPGPDAPWTAWSAILGPRGDVTTEGLVARLQGEINDTVLRLIADGSNEEIWKVRVGPGSQDRAVPLPPDVARDLQAGERYRLVLEKKGQTLESKFRLVAVAGLNARLQDFSAEIRKKPYIRPLIVNQLLEAKLYSEAFLEAERLSDETPGAALPARLALEALADLGLQTTAKYADLVQRFEEAEGP
ncbi:MAG: serine/threonine-protein kinase [Planctomycetota bacterium]|nr:serine/threonine-protein kinase [Planctomycetota bacterium]